MRARGFTLVEVVVALAILGLLVSLLYAALSAVTRVYGAAEQEVEREGRVRVVSGFLTRTLAMAYPLALADGRGWQVQFSGDASRLAFVAELPGHVGDGGLHELVLEAGRRDGQDALWLARRPLDVDPRNGGLSGEFSSRILARGVGTLAVRYFGAADEEETESWRDEWPPARRMPRLVEIRVADVDGTRWPPLTVRPVADTLRYRSVRGADSGQGEGQVPPTEAPSESADSAPNGAAEIPQ